MRKLVSLAALLLLLGCQPIEQTGRDTAAALGGSIAAAQQQYFTECTANPSESYCKTINQAVSAQNALITAIETYCGWPAGGAVQGGTCTPVKSFEAGLRGAIINAKQFENEIKGVLKK